MREQQARIIEELGVRPEIDPAAEVYARVQFLIDYLRATGAGGFVLGISGGQDSSLAGRLCQLAVERIATEGSNSKRSAPEPSAPPRSPAEHSTSDETAAGFIAVRLPYALQHDAADAQLALDFIRPTRTVDFNIQAGVDGFLAEYERALGEPMTDFTKGNVKARARMIAQYAIAGQNGLLVVGTDHAAEAVTGYFTKFGDGASDLVPLAGLTKRQGSRMLQTLGAPERLYLKPPTADLLDQIPGQTDEASLGLSYAEIDDYLEGREVADAAAETLESLYFNSRHKRRMPPSPADTWWR